MQRVLVLSSSDDDEDDDCFIEICVPPTKQPALVTVDGRDEAPDRPRPKAAPSVPQGARRARKTAYKSHVDANAARLVIDGARRAKLEAKDATAKEGASAAWAIDVDAEPEQPQPQPQPQKRQQQRDDDDDEDDDDEEEDDEEVVGIDDDDDDLFEDASQGQPSVRNQQGPPPGDAQYVEVHLMQVRFAEPAQRKLVVDRLKKGMVWLHVIERTATLCRGVCARTLRAAFPHPTEQGRWWCRRVPLATSSPTAAETPHAALRTMQRIHWATCIARTPCSTPRCTPLHRPATAAPSRPFSFLNCTTTLCVPVLLLRPSHPPQQLGHVYLRSTKAPRTLPAAAVPDASVHHRVRAGLLFVRRVIVLTPRPVQLNLPLCLARDQPDGVHWQVCFAEQRQPGQYHRVVVQRAGLDSFSLQIVSLLVLFVRASQTRNTG